jgi:nucleotide-binding universal stress UspA family protein
MIFSTLFKQRKQRQMISNKRYPYQIIVPTDFSKQAKDGLKLAVKLSEKISAKIHLVHFVKSPTNILKRSTVEVDSEQSREQDIYTLELIRNQKAKLAASKEKYADYPITTSIKMGRMSTALPEMAKELDADLIVMGTTGERSIVEIFSGNHAEKVTRKAPCPVITVRKYRNSINFDNILLAVDLSDQREAVNQMVSLAEMLDARLHLLFVDTSSIGHKKEGLIQLKILAKRHRLSNYTLNYISGSDQSDAIREMARLKRADIIAMITENTGFTMDLFAQRVTDTLIKQAKRPVLTVNSEATST